jgi:hypothetical protein
VILTHSNDRARDGSSNLTMSNAETYILDNRNINRAYETNTYRFEYCETKNHTCSSYLEQKATKFLNSSSAIVLADTMDILFHQKSKVSVNFQRIEKRNFGAIP